MSHTDLTQLFNNYEPLFNGTNGNNLGQVAIDIVKKNYSDPLLGPIIFFGIIPLVLSAIALIICTCVNIPVCCRGKYLTYMRT